MLFLVTLLPILNGTIGQHKTKSLENENDNMLNIKTMAINCRITPLTINKIDPFVDLKYW